MRTYDAATLAALQARAGLVARVLFWVRAKNRDTGVEEAMGLWTGADATDFDIDGESRKYYGAGALLGVEPIVMQTGLTVRMHRVSLSPLAPEVAQLLRGYEPRMAPVEIHRALLDPDSHDLVAPPHRVFRGWIDELKITTPAQGGRAKAEVTLASASRALTRTLSLKKSDESQRRRADDRFNRYADVSGNVDIFWGEKRLSEKPSAGGGAGADIRARLDDWGGA